MSTLLQLLANYYESVIESERIYYNSTGGETGQQNKGINSDSILAKETINLQRQITQLTTDLSLLKRQNDRLKELHKTQKAVLESKLDNAKKTISRLRHVSTPEPENVEPDKRKFHLLSPIQRCNGDGRKLEGANLEHSPASKQVTRLRHVISNGKQTLFDDDSEDVSNKTDDIIFVNSLKSKAMLANVVIPNDALSDSDNDQTTSRGTQDNSSAQKAKKRKLIRKRIQTAESESESDNGRSNGLNTKSVFKI